MRFFVQLLKETARVCMYTPYVLRPPIVLVLLMRAINILVYERYHPVVIPHRLVVDMNSPTFSYSNNNTIA